MTEPTAQDRFVDHLVDLANGKNRGALAALRRGLGLMPGEAPEMFPYIVPYLPNHPSRELERAYYLIASLFALHPSNTSEGNIGNHMAACIRNQNDREAIERRFVALLNCHVDDLSGLLRQTVSYLKSKEQPINYKQLLSDLLYWSNREKSVQRHWALGFWSRIEVVAQNQTEAKTN